jgi:hypothetical protein
MSTSPQPMRINHDELFSDEVEEFLGVRRQQTREIGESVQQPFLIRMFYASWFYLSIASGVGAVIAWAVLEPFFHDGLHAKKDGIDLVALFLFPTVAGCIGLFLGAAEGAICRNPRRATLSALVGFGVGFGGGLITLLAAGFLFLIALGLAGAVEKNPQPGKMPTGFAFLILMMGRAAAWALASIPAGLGQGIALKDKKVAINGVVGGVLGGLVGGLLFDPISLAFTTADGKATLSRAIGFTMIGLFVGLFVGLVEGWTKTAWLLMRQGPLAGKQFILFRDVTVLGSSPSADIYLFKDALIEPRHAVIYNRGGRFEVEDCGTPDGTYVNGMAIQRRWLESGDQLALGKTVLEFDLREAK